MKKFNTKLRYHNIFWYRHFAELLIIFCSGLKLHGAWSRRIGEPALFDLPRLMFAAPQ